MNENSTSILANKNNISLIAISNTGEKNKRCNTGHKQDKVHDKYDLIHFYWKAAVQKFLESQMWNLQ